MSQPTYKFKWTNTDLDDYMRNRRSFGQSMRRQAEILIERAQMIEAETHELEISLIPVEEKKVKSEQPEKLG